jgi:hypothetical protein
VAELLEDELISGIGQRRTPKIVNLLPTPDCAQIIDNPDGLARQEAQFPRVTEQYRLVLQNQRNGKRYLELPRTKALQDRKRGASV